MATVTCTHCSAGVSDDQVFCHSCGQPVGSALAPPPHPATAPAAASADGPAVVRRCAARGCGAVLLEGDDPCPYCATPVDTATVAESLDFPWGRHPLRDGESLELGRQHSPFATQLADYPNVGRTHARLTCARGTLLVVDLGSQNGTFVDDRRLAPNTPTELRPGQVVRLAATLEIKVR